MSTGRQDRGRGRGRGGREDWIQEIPSRGRGRGSLLFPSSDSTRGRDQSARGSNFASRGSASFGRGGGRGAPVVEVFRPTDGTAVAANPAVRKLEDEVEKAALAKFPIGSKRQGSENEFPIRPGYGTRGNPILLWANYFEVLTNNKTLLYRYSVEVLSDGPGRLPVGKKLRRVVQILLEDHYQADRPLIATDYKSNLICGSEIASGMYSVLYREDGSDEAPSNPTIYRVRVQSNGVLNARDLMDYLTSSNLSAMLAGKDDIIQALNIIIGHNAKSDPGIFSFGTNRHFEVSPGPAKVANLGAGLHAIRGFFFSIRAATSRLLLNVQVKHTTCYDEGPLGQLMLAYLNENKWDKVKLATFLKKVRVQVTHIVRKNSKGQEIPRIKNISNLAQPGDGGTIPHPPIVPKFGANAEEVKFFLETSLVPQDRKGKESSSRGKKKAGPVTPRPEAAPSQGQYISVSDFFQRSYGITVRSRDLPVVNVGTRQNPSYLPVEVCLIVAGQRAATMLSANQTTQMIRFAVRKPVQNATSIVTDASRYFGANDSTGGTLSHFGIGLTQKLIIVPGRVLVGPEVRYRDSKATNTRFGNWNMESIKFSTTGSLTSWTYLYLSLEASSEARSGQLELDASIKLFQSKLQDLGINVGGYVPGLQVTTTRGSVVSEIDAIINRFFSHATRPPPKLLLVILPSTDTAIYNRIKYVCDVKRGLLNVCVVWSKFTTKNNDRYFANVALKINLKLGGRNQSLDPSKLGVIGLGKTMVVGLDVTHPSPGSKTNAPSVAGIVASVDQWLGQWPAALSIQTARQEMVDDLDSMFKSRLRLWAKHNKGALPENILVYRDGVSEGQYNIVLVEELYLLRKACKETYSANDTKNGLPRISIIVVGKRHNTRFYPTKKEDADRSGNPQNGTVVDRAVTEARNWDFFLQAHTALAGTARPAHYYVVLDEIFRAKKAQLPFANAADVLEDLTHNMCYLFGRATKAVSICPPAYYADLVCERARCYLSHLYDGTTNSTPEGSVVSGVEGVPAQADPGDVRLHENVRDTMFYI